MSGCVYADSGHGPCGGQTTNVGDGRDYCMNHGSLRMSGPTESKTAGQPTPTLIADVTEERDR